MSIEEEEEKIECETEVMRYSIDTGTGIESYTNMGKNSLDGLKDSVYLTETSTVVKTGDVIMCDLLDISGYISRYEWKKD